jgi:predicted nucleic acid-binding protein
MNAAAEQTLLSKIRTLALALAARADLIVSGDQDLLTLERFEGIPIVAAREALQQLVV